MTRQLRRALAPIAGTWLLCQALTLAATPLVFSVAAPEELLTCTCAHGEHATCPMHHPAASGSKICYMRGANDGTIAILGSLLNAVGALAPAVELTPSLAPDAVVVSVFAPTILRPAPPDSPPPRA